MAPVEKYFREILDRINKLTMPLATLSPFAVACLSRTGIRWSRLIIIHDLVIAGSSLLVAMYLRIGSTALVDSQATVVFGSMLFFVVIAGVAFLAFGMYRSVWRYASIPDLVAIIKGASLAIVIFMPAMFLVNRLSEIPRSVPVIQWLVLVMMLGGSRLIYRALRNSFWSKAAIEPVGQIPVLVAGTCPEGATFIHAMNGDPEAPYRVVGILDWGIEHLGRAIQGVPVLGGLEQLPEVVKRLHKKGVRPQRLILAGLGSRVDRNLVDILANADTVGVTVARLPKLVEFKDASAHHKDGSRIELLPVALEDLLERPQTPLNRSAIRRLVKGRRVLVTGAGGTIGSELTRQIAALEPASLTMVDASEFALYTIDLELREQRTSLEAHPVICDVRDRDRVMQVFSAYHPELVFHAAALKHVPMVEINPGEGIRTNVIGTRNVADAVSRYGARAMIQVSTDKAVNPTNVMGASKRLAEMYCQALDLVGAQAGPTDPVPPRLMTVRFGNVLGSSGSVVPLFQRQLARGGPLTVTHPDIKRFFMTVREAVELVLQASAHGLDHSGRRGQIFVLDMGQPVKIADLARRMTCLAGLRPDVDVRIEYTGLRPGEKLYEELFDATETPLPSIVDGVFVAVSCAPDHDTLRSAFADLAEAAEDDDHVRLRLLLCQSVPGYQPDGSDSETPTSSIIPVIAGARAGSVDLVEGLKPYATAEALNR